MIIKQGHTYSHPEMGRVIATKSYNGHGCELMVCLTIPDGKECYPFINELEPSEMKYFGGSQ